MAKTTTPKPKKTAKPAKGAKAKTGVKAGTIRPHAGVGLN